MAQNLADLLKVDLQDLRRKHEDTAEGKVLPKKPTGTRVAYRKVHQAYLRMFLEGAVGSSYAAMDEWEIMPCGRCARGGACLSGIRRMPAYPCVRPPASARRT